MGGEICLTGAAIMILAKVLSGLNAPDRVVGVLVIISIPIMFIGGLMWIWGL